MGVLLKVTLFGWAGSILAAGATGGAPGDLNIYDFIQFGFVGVVLVLIITGKGIRTEREVIERDAVITEQKDIIAQYRKQVEETVIPLLGEVHRTEQEIVPLLKQALRVIPDDRKGSR